MKKIRPWWVLPGALLSLSAIACELTYTALPKKLSETCLYEDMKRKKIDPRAESFSPNYPLWSDGAQKFRYVYLPAGSQIDTLNPDDWKFPVGTIFWKEFRKEDKRLEVRLLKKVSAKEERNWIFGTYAWNSDETEGTLLEWGANNARGTDHDIPSRNQCLLCHGIEKTVIAGTITKTHYDLRPLGFDALDLTEKPALFTECQGREEFATDSSTLDLKTLIQLKSNVTHKYDWAVHAPQIPGNTLTQSALGYFHNNCAACHQKGLRDGFNAPEWWIGMNLRAKVGNATPEETLAYQTTVFQQTTYYRLFDNMSDVPPTLRILPKRPDRSAIWRRMISQSPGERMPEADSKHPDPYGTCVIGKWIKSL